jgi:hypothetical protein
LSGLYKNTTKYVFLVQAGPHHQLIEM